MKILNINELTALRYRPHEYWEGIIAKNDDLDLLKVLLKDEALIGDFFNKEIKKPEKPGLIMIEEFAKLVSKELENSGELDERLNAEYLSKAKKLEGLSDDFIPCEEIVEYGQYLLIKSDKPSVSEEKLLVFKKMADKIKNKLYSIRKSKQDDPISLGLPQFLTINQYDDEGVGGFDIMAAFQIEDKRGDKTAIKIPFDEFLYYKSENRAYIMNIQIVEDVLNFPQTYKTRNLSLLSSLQKYLLSDILKIKEVKICFLAVDYKGRYHSYEVGEFSDIKIDLEKINYVYRNKSTLPFEVVHNLIKL